MMKTLLCLALIAAPASAQTYQSQCRWVGVIWTCETQRQPTQAEQLEAGRALVPDYQDQQEKAARIRLMEAQAEALERQNRDGKPPQK